MPRLPVMCLLLLATLLVTPYTQAQTCSNTQCPNGGGRLMCVDSSSGSDCTVMPVCAKCGTLCECDKNCQCLVDAGHTRAVLYWSNVSLMAQQLDFDMAGGRQPLFNGPTANSRAQAIVHGAIYDAAVGMTSRKMGDLYLRKYVRGSIPCAGMGVCVTPNANAVRAAVGLAAHRTLTAIYPDAAKFGALLQAAYNEFLLPLFQSQEFGVYCGMAWGAIVSNAMLNERSGDGSQNPEDPNYMFSINPAPFVHQPDPLSPGQGFLGSNWGQVRPFLFDSTAALRSRVTPLADPRPNGAAANPYGPYAAGTATDKYVAAYQNVTDFGALDAPLRTDAETQTGLFWAYDGAKNIGVPVRLYNQVIRAIVLQADPLQTKLSEVQLARVFAIANFVLADCGIQAWYEKYNWNFWRPTPAVRAGTAQVDQPGYTAAIPDWAPLGAPHTNGVGAFTPPFPAYPSGHATFGSGALTAVKLALKLPGSFQFGFMSSELDGESFDVLPDGSRVTRPCAPELLTIDSAIRDNAMSRVYLGVHWLMDSVEGQALGEQIAALTANAFPNRVSLFKGGPGGQSGQEGRRR